MFTNSMAAVHIVTPSYGATAQLTRRPQSLSVSARPLRRCLYRGGGAGAHYGAVSAFYLFEDVLVFIVYL